MARIFWPSESRALRTPRFLFVKAVQLFAMIRLDAKGSDASECLRAAV